MHERLPQKMSQPFKPPDAQLDIHRREVPHLHDLLVGDGDSSLLLMVPLVCTSPKCLPSVTGEGDVEGPLGRGLGDVSDQRRETSALHEADKSKTFDSKRNLSLFPKGPKAAVSVSHSLNASLDLGRGKEVSM